MEIFIFWLVFSFMVGFIGSNRNIGFWGAFFLSLFLSPIIGLIITLVSKDKETEEYNRKLLETQQNQQEALDRLSGKDSRSYQTRNYERDTTNYQTQNYEKYSVAEELEKLQKLRTNAAITEDEYQQLKFNLINK